MPRCRGCAGSPANTALPATSRSGRPISMSQPAIANPASSWSATPLRTTCPVTGTGTDKVFTDVAQLCNVHIPAWLATEGMDARQDRFVLRRSGQAGLRRLVDGKSRSASARSRSRTGSTGGRSAGRASWRGSAKALAADAKRDQRGVKPPGSLLLVIILVIIVFIVVVGLTGGVVRRVALVVPELAIDAVGREQLRMRAALDRLAA